MLLKEIRLKTGRITALFNFYKDILGLPVIWQGDNTICVTAGVSRIIFDTAGTIESPFYHFAFNIPSNKFEETFQWIQGKVELLWLDDYKSYIADFTNWHAKSLYFIDPAGNIVELIARLDLKDITDEIFSPRQIRNVSEIGLVIPAKDFDATVTNLLCQYPVAYFDKQPPMPRFRAVGNDEGLFVIVSENRVWFSTKNTISQIFPLEISFIEKGTLFELKM